MPAQVDVIVCTTLSRRAGAMVLSVAEALRGIAETEERSRQFAEYWDGLPKVDLIPRRSSFRPEHLPRILPHLVIHEMVSPAFIRLRLAGSADSGRASGRERGCEAV